MLHKVELLVGRRNPEIRPSGSKVVGGSPSLAILRVSNASLDAKWRVSQYNINLLPWRSRQTIGTTNRKIVIRVCRHTMQEQVHSCQTSNFFYELNPSYG